MKRTLLFSALLIAGVARSQVTPRHFDAQRLADAIYRAEGGARAKAPYGILSVTVRNAAEARRVCIRTIEHAWRDYSQLSTKKGSRPSASQLSFIHFLADRYCPPSVDPVGNRNWKRNVTLLCQ